MEPLTRAGSAAIAPDNVTRKFRMMAANPGLVMTTPRQNGTPEHVAIWTDEADEVVGTAHHAELGVLLDHLARRHGFTDEA